jgi:hypothetical protein
MSNVLYFLYNLIATARSNAVVARPITMEVRINACGKGSTITEGMGELISMIGMSPPLTYPIRIKNRFMLYSITDKAMIILIMFFWVITPNKPIRNKAKHRIKSIILIFCFKDYKCKENR